MVFFFSSEMCTCVCAYKFTPNHVYSDIYENSSLEYECSLCRIEHDWLAYNVALPFENQISIKK